MSPRPIALALLVQALGVAASAETPATSFPMQAVHARALTDVVFERTPERVERGRYLADAVIGCGLCHSPRDFAAPGGPPLAGREYSGAIFDESPGYRLVAPNLTPDEETGAGTWSDDALARAIREGVGHDGRGLGGAMWWWSFRYLSDEDVRAIVVYLRSLPPIRHELPPRLLSAERERQRAESARPLERPVPAPDLSTPETRGEYLIAIADCMGCHTAWGSAGAFAGGNPVERRGESTWSANLTSDPSALGGWSEAMFVARMRSGRDGSLHATMPWIAYRRMTDEDLAAIYAALRTTPPVRHWVNNVDPPTDCAVCGGRHGLGAMNPTPVLVPADIDLGPLDAYAGRFRTEDGEFEIEISVREGVLLASEGGGPSVELVPGEDGRMHGIGLASPIEFERDDRGLVAALRTFELGITRLVRLTESAP